MPAGAKESAEWERTLKVFRRINIGELELQKYSRKLGIVKLIFFLFIFNRFNFLCRLYKLSKFTYRNSKVFFCI